ncbi:carbon-nitrogen hydrolase family protein [Mycolicibacterium goodii]|uniref:carbon-nitrogen hydrolase family protein n=1 Tax=Mycolicibacterium goodii TaxID=134601 RepID=UPI001BDC6410|nr:carbon-nitrogen hydrolase family protein [Mycolicibacterium goodii]MBU8829749.1 carbon-nitrogen hydrolase family protein [Mycolicibacterium goodii]
MKAHRIGAVQAEPIWYDLEATVDKTLTLIDAGADQGVQQIAFPELWLPGYPLFLFATTAFQELPYVLRYRANSTSVDSAQMLRIRRHAKSRGIHVALGYSERAGRSLYMSQCVIDDRGGVVLNRRKLKPTHVERILFGQGDGSDLQVVDTSLGRVGALNCAENMQSLSNFALASQHEEIRIASWPPLGWFGGAGLSGPSTAALNQSNAMSAGLFVVMSTQIVSADGTADHDPAITFTGGGFARVFGPDTSLLSDVLAPDEEGVVVADVDTHTVEVMSHYFDPVGHYGRPDVFSFSVNSGTAARRD